jgi:hypothetical protein
MADNNPNQPTSSVPPKPAEAAKVQPKKETVRISLPPKPAAPQVKLPAGAPTINLIVPQVQEVDTNVKIPNVGEHLTATVAKPTPSAPPVALAHSPAPPPPSQATAVTVETPKAPPAPTKAPVKAPVKAPAAVGGPVRASKVDMVLAVLAALVAIGGLVRAIMMAGIIGS